MANFLSKYSRECVNFAKFKKGILVANPVGWCGEGDEQYGDPAALAA
jgi:hypothetical protein